MQTGVTFKDKDAQEQKTTSGTGPLSTYMYVACIWAIYKTVHCSAARVRFLPDHVLAGLGAGAVLLRVPSAPPTRPPPSPTPRQLQRRVHIVHLQNT